MGTLAVGTKAVLATEKTTFTKLLNKKKDRTERGNYYRGYVAGSARRQDTAEDHRSPPQ